MSITSIAQNADKARAYDDMLRAQQIAKAVKEAEQKAKAAEQQVFKLGSLAGMKVAQAQPDWLAPGEEVIDDRASYYEDVPPVQDKVKMSDAGGSLAGSLGKPRQGRMSYQEMLEAGLITLEQLQEATQYHNANMR